ncbi:hypothetical protein [Texcoconibacillus texcoconensis]|uniref:ABC transporter periplasmic binding protein yphF n=1 Tax=Texcoconibacillus texcoconensis TaxID=1095777 RepID=A0A840QNE2_9BACI|nr:hypothetical protein [Texcoconibacillus texcoconensis]MBB5172902.1 hypothetical protein [Texcoconibacillus texcoconensis]
MRIALLFLLLLILSGCLFPEQERAENQVPYDDQLQSVQMAVNQFQEDQGVLPIRNFDKDTSLYQRYLVDFGQLVPTYMQDPPGNSFENGGVFQYVLVNVETDPEVKLLDLRIVDQVREVQRRVNQYRADHRFIPFDEPVGNGVFSIDYEEIQYDSEPTVESPYNPNHQLPLRIHQDGNVVIDYEIDLQQTFKDAELEGAASNETDLRKLLIESSPFVPVYSLSYTFEDGEIKFFQ